MLWRVTHGPGPRSYEEDPMADVVVRPGLVIPEAELNWRFSRSSGPGGQA